MSAPRPALWLALPLCAVLAACPGPGEDRDPGPGSAAPDLTPETQPPPVPVRPDTFGVAEPFDTTARTDIGAVEAPPPGP